MTPAEQRIRDAVFHIADQNDGDMDVPFVALRRVYIDLTVEYSEPDCEKEAIDQAMLAMERDARDTLMMVLEGI